MNLALAPMDWITDAAFRIVTKQIFDKHNQNNKLRLITEFMNVSWYLRNPEWVYKHLLHSGIEENLTAQIYWGSQEELIKTSINLDQNYDFRGIELNIGCPSPKVIACWWGVGMLYNKKETLETIKKISKNINRHFSIKTRIWLNQYDIQEQKYFLQEASKYCNIISIHWRTYKQSHWWEVDRDFVYDIKNTAHSDCSVFGNWWITSYPDALDKINNLDWIMIWQAAVWNPWIFVNKSPSLEELKKTIIYHLDLMCALEIIFNKCIWKKYLPTIGSEEINHTISNLENKYSSYLKAPIEFRKHLFSYLKWIHWSKEFKQKVSRIKDYKDLKQNIFQFFKKAED